MLTTLVDEHPGEGGLEPLAGGSKPVPHACARVQSAIVDDHRLHRQMAGIGTEPSAVFPIGIAEPAKDSCGIHGVISVCDARVEVAVESDEGRDQGIARPGLAAVGPGADVSVVNPEVNVARVGHGTVASRAARDLQVHATAALRVKLGQYFPERTAHGRVAPHPRREREVTVRQPQVMSVRYFDPAAGTGEVSGPVDSITIHECDVVRRAVILARNITRILPQRPMTDQFLFCHVRVLPLFESRSQPRNDSRDGLRSCKVRQRSPRSGFL